MNNFGSLLGAVLLGIGTIAPMSALASPESKVRVVEGRNSVDGTSDTYSRSRFTWVEVQGIRRLERMN